MKWRAGMEEIQEKKHTGTYLICNHFYPFLNFIILNQKNLIFYLKMNE